MRDRGEERGRTGSVLLEVEEVEVVHNRKRSGKEGEGVGTERRNDGMSWRAREDEDEGLVRLGGWETRLNGMGVVVTWFLGL